MLESTDNFINDKELILRDHLALERTKLANERTLFSYIRTSLYLFTAGFGILQIKSFSHLEYIAWICIPSSIIMFFIGFTRFWKMRKHLKDFTPT